MKLVNAIIMELTSAETRDVIEPHISHEQADGKTPSTIKNQ